ncbi:MAG: TIR domain-containing protein [Lachnospiraceae bacterium]|nr:TIR domain-containing protein [Lachnospiraceae bacterium]MBQ4124247.1 TIR domain-containing protein [bacterium]MBQ6687521.1 TIR domain-containing protein [Bacilli bacterium]
MKVQYDFAFSFAGEDRALVEEIKEGLKGFKVFYDYDYQSELCGKDLYSHLRNLYMQQAKYVVCFISKNYKRKIWTNLEFSAIKERLMATFFASDFLIPIILDEDVLLDDIPSFIGFYKHKCVKETIMLLKTKYEQSLNEDFYLDNIRHFSKYLLQEIVSRINLKGIQAKYKDDYIKFFNNSNEKSFFLLPEEFSNLPCLLLYEDNKENPPSAMITWKRNENIVFSWNPFTFLSEDSHEDISLNELIHKVEYYLINNER